MTQPIDTVLARLQNPKPRKDGKGFRAHCPAHDDTHPSLDVVEAMDGKVLVTCRSRGCSFEDIASAIGLEKREFYPSTGNGTGARWTQEDADAALTNRGLRPETVRYFHVVANIEKQAWEFPLGQNAGVKFKRFAPNREVSKNWVPKGTKHGVYHLKPCVGKDEAWLVEGEPDVWPAHQAGLAAFTFTGGASNVPMGAVEEVAKAGIGVVHIVYDNDDDGRKGAAKVAAAFAKAGIKHTVRRLPGSVGDKGDVTTLYNNLGRDDEKFRAALQTLTEVADPVAEWGGSANSAYSALSALENEKREWPTLVPLQSLNLPTFPVHCLPSPFAQYVRELATTTQTPLALPGSLVLAVLATAVQAKFSLEVRSDYGEPLNLFLAVVLDPGNRKSGVFKHVCGPLFEYQRELAVEEESRVAKLQTERDMLEERLRHTKSKVAREPDPEERGVLADQAKSIAVELAGFPEPHMPRLVVDDITPERPASIMAQQNGRISVLSAEGNVIGVMAGRYSGKNEPNLEVYLKGHSGDPLVVDRITDGRQEHIPNPTLTIGIAIQPTVLRTLARNREFRGRGLVGRFLFSLPKSPLGTREPDPPPMSADTRRAYGARIRSLLTLEPATETEGVQAPHVLRLSPEARTLHIEFDQEVEAKLGPGGDLCTMRDWGGKIVGAALRIAGLLHVGTNLGNAQHQPVTAKVMSHAIEMAKYFTEHAKAAYSEMGADPALEGAKILAAWLARNPSRTTFSKRDAFNNHKTYFEKAGYVDQPLQLLEENGYIRPCVAASTQGPGRPPSPKFEVRPNVEALEQKEHKPQKPPSRGIQANSAVSADCALGPTTGQDDADHGTDDQTVEEQQDPSDSDVLDMVGEFVGRHPEYSREEIVEYLVGEGVSRPKSVLAAKHVAKGLVTV